MALMLLMLAGSGSHDGWTEEQEKKAGMLGDGDREGDGEGWIYLGGVGGGRVY